VFGAVLRREDFQRAVSGRSEEQRSPSVFKEYERQSA
jgi:hypothetical protein